MKVWVLTDDKIGSSKQAIALADILGVKYEVKNVKYTFLAMLPNVFTFFDRFTVSRETRAQVFSGKPDIVIGAGRRLARVMAYIKCCHKGTKVIQILKPNLPLNHFDVLVLPHHDTIRTAGNADARKKIVRVNGAVVRHNQKDLVAAQKSWSKKLSNLSKPLVGVLIGGNARGCKMEARHAKELANLTLEMSKKLEASLIVTTSRRTPSVVSDDLGSRLMESGVPHLFYDSAKNQENPYKAILAMADYFIVTGDSISMTIEALATGKPVYVYSPKSMISNKHWRFVEQLTRDGQVNLLRNNDFKTILTPKSVEQDLKSKILEILKMKLK